MEMELSYNTCYWYSFNNLDENCILEGESFSQMEAK